MSRFKQYSWLQHKLRGTEQNVDTLGEEATVANDARKYSSFYNLLEILKEQWRL